MYRYGTSTGTGRLTHSLTRVCRVTNHDDKRCTLQDDAMSNDAALVKFRHNLAHSCNQILSNELVCQVPAQLGARMQPNKSICRLERFLVYNLYLV